MKILCDTYVRKQMENISDILIKTLILLGLPFVVYVMAYVFDKIFDYKLTSTFLDDLNNR